ncbi:MAG: hypothetical protein ABIH92_03070, partial [Nanoarchaeota archaeon]
DRTMKKGAVAVLIYPWELFRGMAALRTALKSHGSLSASRKLYVHKLNPGKIRKYISRTSLKHKKSKLFFALLPQYMTVLQKA